MMCYIRVASSRFNAVMEKICLLLISLARALWGNNTTAPTKKEIFKVWAHLLAIAAPVNNNPIEGFLSQCTWGFQGPMLLAFNTESNSKDERDHFKPNQRALPMRRHAQRNGCLCRKNLSTLAVVPTVYKAALKKRRKVLGKTFLPMFQH